MVSVAYEVSARSCVVYVTPRVVITVCPGADEMVRSVCVAVWTIVEKTK